MKLVRLILICLAALAFGAKANAAEGVVFVSGMGAKCLDVEGGNASAGTRLIGYQCSGGWNEQFSFNGDGEIKIRGLCVDAFGGSGNNGDQIGLYNCNGGRNQRWTMTQSGQLRGINGRCIDLKGAEGYWFGNQPAILWDCNGQRNQAWHASRVVPGNMVSGGVRVNPGTQGALTPVPAHIIGAGAGNIIGAGAGNIIGAGAGNVIMVGHIINSGAFN